MAGLGSILEPKLADSGEWMVIDARRILHSLSPYILYKLHLLQQYTLKLA